MTIPSTQVRHYKLDHSQKGIRYVFAGKNFLLLIIVSTLLCIYSTDIWVVGVFMEQTLPVVKHEGGQYQ